MSSIKQSDVTNMNQPNANKRKKNSSWSLWTQQILAIISFEIKKNLLSRRALLLYLIVASPLGLLALYAILRMPADKALDFNSLSVTFATIYSGLILRTLVFFGCAWFFMNLFRGEIVDRSLHYYFLASVKREIIVVGKYLSGLITTSALFSITTIGSMLILYFSLYPSESVYFFTNGAGATQMLTYLGVTILACIGYGSVFLLVGLFFRNPIVPGLLLYGWEWINFLLPPLLKKFSVIHYLHSLVPVPVSEGLLAIVVEPTPAWISVPSLLLFTCFMLFLASLYIRRMEINYEGN